MSDKGNRISQVVENRQHIIKHCRGKMFTSESLKIVALICMLIDHAGATLFPQCDILRSIGRVSFPLYAFLLAQGCKHTHSMERYLLGLGIFALISEIPYDLAFGNSINFLDQTNIFYTLFLSAACVYIYDSIKKQKTMIQLIVFAVCLLFLFMEWILLTFITGERLPSVALMFSYVMGMIISCAHIFKHHEIANSKSNILINIFPILSTLPAFLPQREYLFVNSTSGRRYSAEWARKRMGHLLQDCGIDFERVRKYERGPCLHCFRITFVAKAFDQLLQTPLDFADALPFISTYLGHCDLRETDKYLQANYDFFQRDHALITDYTRKHNIFPEVIDE